MDEKIDKMLDVVPLDAKTQEIAQRILTEDNLDTVKDLTHLFNLNQARKNVMRVIKLNGLLDKVSDQIIERFEKRPGEFSNTDLLNYLTVTQSAIDRANKSLNLVDETPAIQVQQNNQVNINIVDGLDRESKTKVIDAIRGVLSRMKTMEQSDSEESVENNETIILEEHNYEEHPDDEQ